MNKDNEEKEMRYDISKAKHDKDYGPYVELSMFKCKCGNHMFDKSIFINPYHTSQGLKCSKCGREYKAYLNIKEVE